eukprot:TRINITY_DN1430_c0_g1_i1.p1 TRINITY_DN1430_c0_g1~~TRINITY_DN1430_c0_g1_i1.p1  ORF type:complete len:207 (+),score=63.75 TRINITY_DN1430_c0_g1_i1:130-750(+)
MAVKISNKEAAAFWEKHKLADKAPWDAFKKAYETDYPITVEPSVGVAMTCMNKMLCPKGETEVSSTYFGELVDWFGPLKGDKPMVSRMIHVMSQACFFGDLSSDEAIKMLKAAEVGKFLLRLGHKQPGSYVLTVCRNGKTAKEVGHVMVEYEKGFWSCKQLKIDKCDRISKLIEGAKKAKPADFVRAVGGSPFGSIFPYFNEDDNF